MFGVPTASSSTNSTSLMLSSASEEQPATHGGARRVRAVSVEEQGRKVHRGGHGRNEAGRDALGGGTVHGLAHWALYSLTTMPSTADASC